jgi:hypothetical protein
LIKEVDFSSSYTFAISTASLMATLAGTSVYLISPTARRIIALVTVENLEIFHLFEEASIILSISVLFEMILS